MSITKIYATEELVEDKIQEELNNFIIVSPTEPTVQEGKIWLKPVE